MTMHASLAQPHRLSATLAPAPAPLLAPEGAAIVLGESPRAQPIRAAAHTMFGPRGAAWRGRTDRSSSATPAITACWSGATCPQPTARRPISSSASPISPARGATARATSARRRSTCRPASRSAAACSRSPMPGTIASCSGTACPTRSNRPADIVLGQADFSGGLANRGADAPAADTLNWCYGVAIADGRLIVADTGNRRVLVWDAVPEDERRAGRPGARPARFHHARRERRRWRGAPACAGRTRVAAAGRHALRRRRRQQPDHGLARAAAERRRAVRFRARPGRSRRDRPQSRRLRLRPPRALNMPYGLAALGDRLVVADTANSRLLGLRSRATLGESDRHGGRPRSPGSAAFTTRATIAGSGRRATACAGPTASRPAAIPAIVADSGNNRVLLLGWRMSGIERRAVSDREIRVRGRVQGVGFRPTVWRLARELGLSGEVLNDGEGVLIRVAGEAAAIAALLDRLRARAAAARAHRADRDAAASPATVARASASSRAAAARRAPRSRPTPRSAPPAPREIARSVRAPLSLSLRHLHALRTAPQHRRPASPTTAPRRRWRLPAVRRLPRRVRRSRPTAASTPRPSPATPAARGRGWCASTGARSRFEHASRCSTTSTRSCTLLQRGHIVAIKGLGGYQLACDATNADAVARLRAAKHRETQAVRADGARSRRHPPLLHASTPTEARLLASPDGADRAAARRRAKRCPTAVAPGLATLGFMLPTTPLHRADAAAA